MRRSKVSGAALGADPGVARVRVLVRTKLDIIRSPTKTAEQRLAERDPMAIVAKTHEGPLRQRMALIPSCADPNGSPQTIALNVVESRKPKDFVGELRRGRANSIEAPVRMRNHQDTELLLSENP